MILIRAFKAISDTDACMKFAEGHLQVLQEFDIQKISPMNLEWIKDPLSYVITAESTQTGKMLAGAQLQLGGGRRPLPIEHAIKEIDERVHEAIRDYGIDTTGELYGQWNAREINGLGIGNYYLTLAALAIAPQINLRTMFALCSPSTVEHYTKFGFRITYFLGNNGTFFYPKKDLTAIGMVLADCETMLSAAAPELEIVSSLRANPIQTRVIESRKSPFEIEFNLEIKASFPKLVF